MEQCHSASANSRVNLTVELGKESHAYCGKEEDENPMLKVQPNLRHSRRHIDYEYEKKG